MCDLQTRTFLARYGRKLARDLHESGATFGWSSDTPEAPFLERGYRVETFSRSETTELKALRESSGDALFWSARMADRLQLFITPRTAGERGVRWDVVPLGTVGALQARRIHPVGTDMLIEGYVHRPD